MATAPSESVDLGIHTGQVFLGKYRVEAILGHGAMGIVAKCTHLTLNEAVAIKMLRKEVLSNRDVHERFMREAQAAAKLRSEYVARVTDVGTFEDNVPFIVMEFLDGLDLGELLEERGSLPAPWASELMLQAAEALAEAHSINIVHRDVKPSNLFVTWRPDGSALIKVLDFGISKAPADNDLSLTQTQSLLGTPAYMSPEQMRSARMVDARSDIWSLGTVFYELLENRKPFEADSFSEMCVKVAVDPPAPMVNTPPELQAVVTRCLAKAPEQRYQSMAELGEDLIPFCQNQQEATILVERMQRLLRRSGSDKLDRSTSSAVRVPREARDLQCVGFAIASRDSLPASSAAEGRGSIARARTPLPARAITPSELLEIPRRRWPVALAAVLTAGAAIALSVAFIVRGGGDNKPASAAKPPTETRQPAATVPAVTVAPAPTPPPPPAASVPVVSPQPAAPLVSPTDPTATTKVNKPKPPKSAKVAQKPPRAAPAVKEELKGAPMEAPPAPAPPKPKPKCNVFDSMHPGDCIKSQ